MTLDGVDRYLHLQPKKMLAQRLEPQDQLGVQRHLAFFAAADLHLRQHLFAVPFEVLPQIHDLQQMLHLDHQPSGLQNPSNPRES